MQSQDDKFTCANEIGQQRFSLRWRETVKERGSEQPVQVGHISPVLVGMVDHLFIAWEDTSGGTRRNVNCIKYFLAAKFFYNLHVHSHLYHLLTDRQVGTLYICTFQD